MPSQAEQQAAQRYLHFSLIEMQILLFMTVGVFQSKDFILAIGSFLPLSLTVVHLKLYKELYQRS